MDMKELGSIFVEALIEATSEGADIPCATVSYEPELGLRIELKWQEKNIRIVYPLPEGDAYIYREDKLFFEAIKPVTTATIKEQLIWVSKEG